MSEPTTVNTGLIVPNTGDLVGAWGTAALNPNFQLIDGRQGGVLNLSFSSATSITLTTTTASFTPGAGPFQTDNAAIVVAGTLSGNGIIKLTMPGVYRLQNNCVVGSNYIQIAPASGTGNAIGAPDGEFRRIFFDGTNVWFLDMPHVGTFVDFCIATSPAWFSACTIPPYLLCNGATYSTASFAALSARLGSTFGGNGVTTFGVPDHQNRYFIPMDFGGNNRITSGVSGINGAQFGASGGDQNVGSHTHSTSVSVTDPGHFHTASIWATQAVSGQFGGGFNNSFGNASTNSTTTGISVGVTVSTNSPAGVGANIPPGLVGGIRFIKT